MPHPRTIAVVTSTRAEYGLLRPLLAEITADPALALRLVASGMHLSPEFGLTWREIAADGWTIHERVEMLLSADTPTAIAKSIALGVIGFADAFARLAPDLVLLLGDRFEILAAAQAALVARIPLAHIHGGEATEGLMDEAIRHAVTKMAQLHFVAAEPYRQRVIQLGETPERVFTVGAPGLDALATFTPLTRAALEEGLAGFSLAPPLLLVTYHPVTLRHGQEAAVAALCNALDHFPQAQVLITRPNADTEGRAIIRLLDEYAARQPQRVRVVTSLGSARYLSAASHAAAVVGNSSSGLIEVPLLGTPTVNIGDRQRGRLRAPSVIDCGEAANAIAAAIDQALSPAFQAVAAHRASPYGSGGASRRIVAVLREADLDGIVVKHFHDLPPAPPGG